MISSEKMFKQVTEGMTEEEVIKEQEKFVNWLNERNWYSEWLSVREMQLMHSVWKSFQKKSVKFPIGGSPSKFN